MNILTGLKINNPKSVAKLVNAEEPKKLFGIIPMVVNKHLPADKLFIVPGVAKDANPDLKDAGLVVQKRVVYDARLDSDIDLETGRSYPRMTEVEAKLLKQMQERADERMRDLIMGQPAPPTLTTYMGVPLTGSKGIVKGTVSALPGGLLMHPDDLRELSRAINNGQSRPTHLQAPLDQAVADYFSKLPQDKSGSSLHSQSGSTITGATDVDDEMTDAQKADFTEVCETLVELDRVVAQFGGRFDNPIKNQRHVTATVLDAQLIPMGDDAFVVGETFKPHGLALMQGQVMFVFAVTADDTLYRYAALNVGQLEDSFPAVYEAAQNYMRQNTNSAIAGWVYSLQSRIAGKPQLVRLCQDYLKQGRLVNAGLRTEQAEKDAEQFYEETNDFGLF